MVYTCFLCKWRSDKHPQRSYHKFPSNNELKQKWLDILGKSNVSVGTRTTLCCLHFKEDCFRYGLVYGRKVLKDGSLPTLYLTKGDKKGPTIKSIDDIKILKAPTESSLRTQHPTTDNVQMKHSASELNIEDKQMQVTKSELDVENNLADVAMEISLPKASSRKSDPIDEQPGKLEMVCSKKKRLWNSKTQMKSQLTEAKKTVNKYEAENKLMHIKRTQGRTLAKRGRRAWLKAAGREDLVAKIVDDSVRQQYRICEDHFEKTCIKFSKKRTRKYLLDSAFPTLNLELYNRARFSQCETVSTEENQEFQNVSVIETSSSSNENLIKINYLQTVISCNIETDAKDIDCASESRSVQTSLQLAAINPRKRKLPIEVVFTARGLCPPVFTPLNEDYSVNYEAIAPYAKFLADNGIKSVLVGGTTGEHMSLSVADRKKIVDEWVKEGKSIGLHIMVQVGGAPLADVLDLARYCSEVGVDSLLTLPELYFKPQTASELVSYVELIANVAPNLPVLYYHIPSMSKVEINMPSFVTEATIRIPNFKGIKFTSNDLSEGAQVLRCLKDGQEMFLGADTLLAPAALLGIKSSIGTTFNLFPRLAQDILDAVDRADIAEARALQEKLSLAIEAHTVEGPWVPIMKAGMEIVTGIQVGPPSLPQRPLSKEAKNKIASRLKALKLID
ncbi:unnamed protein product, partial [Brenthis ino]